MRFLVFIAISMLLAACVTVPGAKDRHWGYFEDWDINRNLSVDANEFVHSYIENDFFKKWGGRKSKVSAGQLVSKLSEDGEKLSKALIASRDMNSVASAQSDSANRVSANNINDVLPAIIADIDRNNDHFISREEWAQEMFNVADENNDQSLTAIEFYLWQVLRP